MATHLLRRFTDVVRLSPNTPAVVEPEFSISYAMLDELSDNAAAFLTQSARTEELQNSAKRMPHSLSVLGFYHSRSARHVIAAVGAAKAGIPYMPMGLNWPPHRLKAVMENCHACLLVCDNKTETSEWRGDTPCITTEDLIHAESGPSTWDASKMADVFKARYESTPPPLYVIHTSGSTGAPKGVALPHDGICANFVGSRGMPGFEPGKHVLYGGALTFDLSIIELWISLLNGCTLVLTQEETLLDAQMLKAHLEKWSITTAAMPVSVMSALAAQDAHVFSPLEVLIFGGELPNKDVIRSILHACPNLVMNNSYGTAETCAVAAAENLTLPLPEGPLPVGKPYGDAELYVVDEDLTHLPAGQIGELLIGGPGVGLGYINDPERNARVFVTDPQTGRYCYRTGDMAYMRPDGRLVLVGRSDAQFKIGGKRVDPEEISAAILCKPGISRVHISFIRGEFPAIVAYVVPRHWNPSHQQDNAFSENLRTALRKELPAYLIPKHIILLETIPLTAHGKVDEKNLPAPPAMDSSSVDNDICAAFQTALRERNFSEDDTFFEHGGTSLVAAQLIAHFRSTHHVAVPFSLFSRPRTAHVVRLFIENTLMTSQTHPIADGATPCPSAQDDTGRTPENELTFTI